MKIYLIGGIVLFLLSLIEIFYQRNGKRVNIYAYFFLLGISILFFSGRWFVGWDWFNYYPDYVVASFNYETGYRLFVEYSKKIINNYQFFIGLNNIIDFVILGYIIPKYSKYPITTLLIFFTVNGLNLETDVLRNGKSIFLFLLSLKFIEKRELIKFILLNLLGAAFHISSFLYLPLYFILPREFSKKTIFAIFVLGNLYYFSGVEILGRLFDTVIFSRLSGYSHLNLGERVLINPFYIERVLFFMTVFIYKIFVSENSKKIYTIFENALYISVYIFLFTWEIPVIGIRFFLLMSFAYWFIPGIVIESLERGRGGMRKVIFLAFIYSVAFFRGQNFYTFPGNQIVYPYENYFFRINTYKEKREKLIEALKYKEEGIRREIMLLY